MDKIKIMHLINCFTMSSSELFVYNLAETLDKDKFDVYICSIVTLNTEDEHKILERLKLSGINLLFLNKPPRKNRSKAVLALVTLLKKINIKILNTHCASPDFYGKSAALLAKTPYIYSTIHNIGGCNKNFEKLYKLKTTKYIATSKVIKNYMTGNISIPEDKIELIYSGIKIPEVNKKHIRNTLLKKLNIDEGKLIISNVGKVIKQSGHNYLIQAAYKILETYPHVHFIINGNSKLDIEWSNKLLNMLKEYKIERNFTFTESDNDIEDLLVSSDIFVFTSLTNTFPQILVKSIGVALPVISLNIDNISEVIEHNKNGLLIELDESTNISEEIARYIYKIIDNQSLLNQLSIYSKNRFTKDFNLLDSVKQYETMYVNNYVSNSL